MEHAYFVAGTDTGVGKSVVAAGLLAAAADRGMRTVGLKPVAAGCDEQGHNEDALLLQSVMTETLDYSQVNPVALRQAIAPHLAALHEGRKIRCATLAAHCRDVLSGPARFAVVEGAGGWRVPLNHRETIARLAVELQLPVILVVGMRLGCINHALLSAEAIRGDGLRLAGWVANRIDPDMACYPENVATLAAALAAPLLAEIPWLREITPIDCSQYMNIKKLFPANPD